MIPDHKKNIMVHCLATPKGWADGHSPKWVYNQVYQWHVKDRGWSDVAYARIYMPNGDKINGRDLDKDGDVWEETGAGARGWNRDTIHLALVGGLGSSANDEWQEHYTHSQMQALRDDIDAIQDEAGRTLNVMGHNEVAAKACPGFNAKEWYYQKPKRTLVKSKTIQGGGAAAVGGAGAAATAVSQLEGNAQLLIIGFAAVVILGALWVFRARIIDWVNGRR